MHYKVCHYMLKFFQNPAFFLRLEHDGHMPQASAQWQNLNHVFDKLPRTLFTTNQTDSFIPLALYRASVVTMAIEIKLWNGWYHSNYHFRCKTFLWLPAYSCFSKCIDKKQFYRPHPFCLKRLFCDLGPTEEITALRCSGTPQSKPLK